VVVWCGRGSKPEGGNAACGWFGGDGGSVYESPTALAQGAEKTVQHFTWYLTLAFASGTARHLQLGSLGMPTRSPHRK
jgi:hypothetical protein